MRVFVLMAMLVLSGCMSAGPEPAAMFVGRTVEYDLPENMTAEETNGWKKERQTWRADGTYSYWQRPLLVHTTVFEKTGRWFMDGNRYCEGTPGAEHNSCYKVTPLPKGAGLQLDLIREFSLIQIEFRRTKWVGRYIGG
jgi:hypothetical protein